MLSRPCSISLWSPWLFLLSTHFLAQFPHDKMSCSHSMCTWLNVKDHPLIRSLAGRSKLPRITVSHLFLSGICNFCTCFIASLRALLHCVIPCGVHATSKKAAEWVSNQFHLEPGRRRVKGRFFHAPCGLDHISVRFQPAASRVGFSVNCGGNPCFLTAKYLYLSFGWTKHFGFDLFTQFFSLSSFKS